ncbi:MAG: guanylate kinase [Clostridiales bacterium]|nr:guanylate kinase [Clostridiales bacterium]
MKNILVVLSGPSGVGKGTIAKLLIDRNPEFCLSISCTTRAPRAGETDGKEYFFIDKTDFLTKIDANGFLEYSEHFGNYYGTPKTFVTEKLKSNDVILEIDVNGGLNVKKNYPKAVLIMIAPPSLEELKNRLVNRHTESEEQILNRMERIEYELGKKELYDYTVINDDLTKALEEIEEIIKNEKSKN